MSSPQLNVPQFWTRIQSLISAWSVRTSDFIQLQLTLDHPPQLERGEAVRIRIVPGR